MFERIETGAAGGRAPDGGRVRGMAGARGPSVVHAVSTTSDDDFGPGALAFDGVAGLRRFCLGAATPDPARFRVRREIEALGRLRIGTVELSPMQLLTAYVPAFPAVAVLRRGSADARIEGRTVTLVPGDGIAFARLDPRGFTSRSASAWYLLASAEPAPWTGEVKGVSRIGTLAPTVQTLTASALAAIRSGAATPGELRHLERAVAHVLDGLFAEADPDDVRSLEASFLRRRAQALIEDAYTDPELRSAAIARTLNVSLRTLQRAYGEASGSLTVSDDIARCRREHAARILEDPNLSRLSIESIAERSGYPRQAGLRRAFLQAFGMSPTEYRAARRREAKA